MDHPSVQFRLRVSDYEKVHRRLKELWPLAQEIKEARLTINTKLSLENPQILSAVMHAELFIQLLRRMDAELVKFRDDIPALLSDDPGAPESVFSFDL